MTAAEREFLASTARRGSRVLGEAMAARGERVLGEVHLERVLSAG